MTIFIIKYLDYKNKIGFIIHTLRLICEIAYFWKKQHFAEFIYYLKLNYIYFN